MKDANKYPQKISKQEWREYAEKFWPSFDFEPLFFILDNESKWVMAVREQNRYEMKGTFLAYYGPGKFEKWPACMNAQMPYEYNNSFEFTKNEAEALLWAVNHAHLPDTIYVQRECNPEFPIY
jgi:hypothetical protein